jgi:hypothetical protein
MYRVLTANTPGCVAFSLPVQRWNLTIFEIPTFSDLPLRASAWRGQKSGGGSQPGRCSVPRALPSQGQFRGGKPRCRAPCGGLQVISGEARSAPGTWPSAKDKLRAASCRRDVPDGPTLDAPDCVADQSQRKNRADAEPVLRPAAFPARARIGAAQLAAFRPSPHPRIRWTVASADRAASALGPTRPPPPRVKKCPTRC